MISETNTEIENIGTGTKVIISLIVLASLVAFVLFYNGFNFDTGFIRGIK